MRCEPHEAHFMQHNHTHILLGLWEERQAKRGGYSSPFFINNQRPLQHTHTHTHTLFSQLGNRHVLIFGNCFGYPHVYII